VLLIECIEHDFFFASVFEWKTSCTFPRTVDEFLGPLKNESLCHGIVRRTSRPLCPIPCPRHADIEANDRIEKRIDQSVLIPGFFFNNLFANISKLIYILYAWNGSYEVRRIGTVRPRGCSTRTRVAGWFRFVWRARRVQSIRWNRYEPGAISTESERNR